MIGIGLRVDTLTIAGNVTGDRQRTPFVLTLSVLTDLSTGTFFPADPAIVGVGLKIDAFVPTTRLSGRTIATAALAFDALLSRCTLNPAATTVVCVALQAVATVGTAGQTRRTGTIAASIAAKLTGLAGISTFSTVCAVGFEINAASIAECCA